jgi:AcrR family transcriptional regulator
MNQKTRTRAAIKAAAADFVQRGEKPNMAQIAEAALVSKSTAYRYFPSLDALLAEILLDITIKSDLEGVYAAAKTPGTPAARLEAVVRADHALVVKHEHAFRTALRVLVTPYPDAVPEIPRRPGYRLRYLADALTPLHDQVGSEGLERLVMALAFCVGIESIVVMEDICGLTPAEAETVKLWAAGALLQAALWEGEADPAPKE